MVENKKPCLGCTRRKVTRDYNCHSHCPDYLGIKEEDMARAEIIRKKKAEDAEFVEMKIRAVNKTTGKQHKQSIWKG